MHRPAFLIVVASLSGLVLGAVVPGAEQLRPLSLPGLFLQTLIAVGALAQAHVPGPRGWATRTLVIYHVGVSLPLIALGIALGLDTPLGAGTFLLGAVPPAAGLPSYAASTGAQVRPIVRFCLLSYVLGVFVTPALVLVAFGTHTRTGATVLTLTVGLILPALLGGAAHSWLRRIPSRVSFAIVACTVLVLTLSIGPSLRTAVAAGIEDPAFLWGAAAVGFGRIVWGAALGLATSQRGMRLESALAVTYRNAVLAAVIAYAAVGPLAALPALLSLFGEAAFLVTVSVLVSRRGIRHAGADGAPSGEAERVPAGDRGRPRPRSPGVGSRPVTAVIDRGPDAGLVRCAQVEASTSAGLASSCVHELGGQCSAELPLGGRAMTQTARTPDPLDVPVDPDYPIDPVPAHARKSLFSLAVVLLGFTFFTPTMLAGAQIGAAFRFGPLMAVLLLGSAVLGVYVAVLGAIGARTGLTTVLMARYSFGDKGSKLVSVLLGGTQVGWYGVTVAVLAQLTAQALGWESSGAEIALMVAGGAIMGATAYWGYKGMYALSLVSVPLLLVLAGWVTWRSLVEVGGWAGLAAVEPTEALSVAAAVTIIVGTFASGGTQAPNWTRFARTPTIGFVAALIAFLVGQLLMLFFGAIGAVAFGEPDFVLVLFQLGLVAWGVVFLIGNLWTTNDNTAYNFGVAGAEIFNSPTKKPFVVGGVVLGTVLAITGIYDNLIQYLVWLGILIPPVGGVIIGDFLARWRHGVPDVATHDFPAVQWGNVGAYALGSLVAWASQELSWGIPPVNGILVALVAATVVSRSAGSEVRTAHM